MEPNSVIDYFCILIAQIADKRLYNCSLN